MNINLTFVGQLVTFAVLIAFIYKYVWPPVMATIDGRAKTISDGLAAAEQGRKELDEASARRSEMMKDARDQAAKIIKEGERKKTQIIEDARGEAEAEKARILKEGRSELEQERNAMAGEMRARVADLVVAGAEKILQAEVDAAKHSALLESLRNRL